jgi:hypothetical protein
VNNSFYDNDTKNTGAGEFQIQYYSTNNLFENNIVYASSQNLFIYGYTTSSGVTADYNVYYSAGGAANSNWTWKMIAYTGFGPYKTASGQDVHSIFANPQYVSLTTPDLHVQATSPAKDTGTNPGATVVGAVDFAGNARAQGAGIDIGAYEQ